MWQKIQNLFSAPSLAVARNVLMAVSGVLCALGFLSATQAQAIIDKIMAVGTAFGVLVGAVSALVMVVLPIISGFKSTAAAQKKSVSLQPHTVVVTMPDADSAVRAANQIAAISDVSQVIASPRVVIATPSDKVVVAAQAAAANAA